MVNGLKKDYLVVYLTETLSLYDTGKTFLNPCHN